MTQDEYNTTFARLQALEQQLFEQKKWIDRLERRCWTVTKGKVCPFCEKMAECIVQRCGFSRE